MSALIISNILILGGTALAAAIVLYIVSQKFRVEENPKIAEIEALLPGANCGACGKAGCHAFAVACANSSKEQFKELFCTAGGKEVMDKVAAELGYVAAAREPTVAVLKCNGTCQNAPDKVVYTGMKSCRMAPAFPSAAAAVPTAVFVSETVSGLARSALSAWTKPREFRLLTKTNARLAAPACALAPAACMKSALRAKTASAFTLPAATRKRELWPAKTAKRPVLPA